MSSSERPSESGRQRGAVRFNVIAGDEAAEIFVIDGDFRRVASGIGRLDTRLTPGLYKVKVRTGRSSMERYLEVRPGDPPLTMEFEPAPFASAAPLEHTAKTHEYHLDAARKHSQLAPADISLGRGGSLFLFARDWSGQYNQRLREPSLGHPARGLSIGDADGNLVADLQLFAATNLAEARENAYRRTRGEELVPIDPWAACHIALEPGPYILRLDTPKGRLEQTVVVSEGWQTQVFLTQRAYVPGLKELVPDLPCASIQLARPDVGFNPRDPDQRLVELARLGLTDRRAVVSEELLGRILHLKFKDPMLGLLGAYILLRAKKPDLKALRIVVGNLRKLLGKRSHPDVEVLALRLDGRSAYNFEVPPMLRSSWKILIPRTVGRPELIPAGSLPARIAHLTWIGEPWLIWQPTAAGSDQPDIFLEGVREQIEPLVRRAREALPAVPVTLTSEEAPSSPKAASKAAAALRIHEPDAKGVITTRRLSTRAGSDLSAADESVPVSQGAIRELVEATGLPQSVLKGLVESME